MTDPIALWSHVRDLIAQWRRRLNEYESETEKRHYTMSSDEAGMLSECADALSQVITEAETPTGSFEVSRCPRPSQATGAGKKRND